MSHFTIVATLKKSYAKLTYLFFESMCLRECVIKCEEKNSKLQVYLRKMIIERIILKVRQ